MGAYYICLVAGIILTVVFITLMIIDNEYGGDHWAGIFLCGLFAMVSWAGFFFGVGDKHGANAVARGEYKTYYLYDKDGNVTDTIAKWNNGN